MKDKMINWKLIKAWNSENLLLHAGEEQGIAFLCC